MPRPAGSHDRLRQRQQLGQPVDVAVDGELPLDQPPTASRDDGSAVFAKADLLQGIG
jgi:hypothetical protein